MISPADHLSSVELDSIEQYLLGPPCFNDTYTQSLSHQVKQHVPQDNLLTQIRTLFPAKEMIATAYSVASDEDEQEAEVPGLITMDEIRRLDPPARIAGAVYAYYPGNVIYEMPLLEIGRIVHVDWQTVPSQRSYAPLGPIEIRPELSHPHDDSSHPLYQPLKGQFESYDEYVKRLCKIMDEDMARKPNGRQHAKDRLEPVEGMSDNLRALRWMESLGEEQKSLLGEHPRPAYAFGSVSPAEMKLFFPSYVDISALCAAKSTLRCLFPSEWCVYAHDYLPRMLGEWPEAYIERLWSRLELLQRRVYRSR